MTQQVSGWGGTPASSPARLTKPASEPEILEALSGALPVAPRGLGRSYGDAAQVAAGLVMELTHLKPTFELDERSGSLTVSTGYSLGEILERVLPRGWFLPVTPGTRFVTAGGAVASDVHGKNHHRDGSFSMHLSALELLTPSGTLSLYPGDPAFAATAGGMGLTGVISKITVKLLPVETSRIKAVNIPTRSLGDTFEVMSRDGEYTYAVAWIDATATGSRLGRGLASFGEHAKIDELAGGAIDQPLAYHPKTLGTIPVPAPSNLLNPLSVRLFNSAWFQAGVAGAGEKVTSLDSFFYPLDAVGSWNRLYGRRGFLQYQVVVPYGSEDLIETVIGSLAKGGHPSFLTVLKRFGAQSAGLLSFPKPGWTLALDIPAKRPGLSELLRELDRKVAASGGRVYLAKDARLDPNLLEAMYPDLRKFEEICRELDPEGVMATDLARRLRIGGRH